VANPHTSIGRIDLRQLRLICTYSLRHSIRTGAGLVFVLFALFFGLTVANAVISPFETLVAQSGNSAAGADQGAVEQRLVAMARPAVEWAISPPKVDDPVKQAAAVREAQRWADYLLVKRPALMSAILFVLIFGMPFLVSLGAFNQTSGDIGSRGLRYLLLRTERANIFYGRLLATMLLTVLVQAALMAIIALYLALKVRVYGGWDVAAWSLHGLLALAVLSLPYVAVCAWISASTESTMASLVLCELAIGGVLLAAFIGARLWEPAYALRYALPWGVQNELLSPSAATVALTVGACLLYALVFTWLGARVFDRRDL